MSTDTSSKNSSSSDSSGSDSSEAETEADPTDDEWESRALDIAPGMIVVGRPAHRRLLEEVGKADEPRVEFVGDAAKRGSDSDE